MFNDYEVLGIKKGSSLKEIRKAYRPRVKKFHPDLVSDENRIIAHMSMIRLNSAYKNLMDLCEQSQESLDVEKKAPVAERDYIPYKSGIEIYKNTVESLWFSEEFDSSDTANIRALKFLIRELPIAYYHFSIVANQFPESPWVEDAKKKMKTIENMTPRYKKILSQLNKK